MREWLHERLDGRRVMFSATLGLAVTSVAWAPSGNDSDVNNLGPDNLPLLGQFPSSDNPPQTDHGGDVAQHLKIDPSVLDRLPMQKQPVVPA